VKLPDLLRFESPILNRELKALLRSRKSFIWLFLYLAILAITFSTSWSSADATNRDLTARQLFYTVTITQALVFYFLAPILTAGSISTEHERRTFEILATTPLSGYHVALSKLFSAICYIGLLVVASIPMLAITFLMGGVGWAEFVTTSVVLLTSVMVNGMAGVMFSAWIRRTFIALMVSLVFVAGLVFFCPCAGSAISSLIAFSLMGGGVGGKGALYLVLGMIVGYGGIQLVVFLILLGLANAGYRAGPQSQPVRRKRVIRNPRVLRERRRRFPYYLIDPLKAPPPIKDGANPVYVRDTRLHPFGRLDFIIRMSYACMLASIFLGLYLVGDVPLFRGTISRGDMFESMVKASNIIVFGIVVAAPFFGSTAFSSEKENGTFPLLMTSLLKPEEIVWAKLRITFRYSLVLTGAFLFPALLVTGTVKGGIVAFLWSLLWLFPFYCVVTAMSALVGLFISALSRRTVQSVALTYLVVALICFGPWLAEGLFGLESFRLLGVLISPFEFLSSRRDDLLNAMKYYESPLVLLFYAGLWAVALGVLFNMTVAALKKAAWGDAALRKAA